ncbi:10744_t:CDS:2, partial [Cetraspora pellucida]
TDYDDEEINIGLREQEQDIHQILFKSLIRNNLFSIQPSFYDSHLTTKPKKAIYAELFGLSKKAIDLAIKSDMSQELVNTLKLFLNNVQDKNQQTNNDDNQIVINNPNIVKHKGQPPKRLKSNIDGGGDNDATSVVKGCMCRKYKQYRHYAKTCQA